MRSQGRGYRRVTIAARRAPAVPLARRCSLGPASRDGEAAGGALARCGPRTHSQAAQALFTGGGSSVEPVPKGGGVGGSERRRPGPLRVGSGWRRGAGLMIRGEVDPGHLAVSHIRPGRGLGLGEEDRSRSRKQRAKASIENGSFRFHSGAMCKK